MPEGQHDDVVRFVGPRTTALGVVVMPRDRSDVDADARFAEHGGLRVVER